MGEINMKIKTKNATIKIDKKKYQEAIKMLNNDPDKGLTDVMIVPENKVIKNSKTVVLKQLEKQKYNILCIILKEGKGSSWLWINDAFERFSYEENTYFKVDSGTYHKGSLRLFIYLEGVSLPMHHGYIKREKITKQIKDRNTGKLKDVIITKIKGLKFDSKVIDVLLNRNLADEFTKVHMDLPNLAIVILLVLNLIVGVASTYGSFT
jgi:hypothetical protein